MTSADAFSRCHPLVNLVYFALTLLFTSALMHPACLAVSLLCALAYRLYLGARSGARFALRAVLPAALAAAVINPAFSHEGVTALAYLPSGNALTLESILYGLAAGAMLASALCLFSCCTAVMSTDKLVYLFGRIVPALSLVISMSLRFVPRFSAQLRSVWEARRTLRAGAPHSPLLLAADAVSALSATVTWALESAIDAADSMKSRAYGLPGRTAFSIYRFDGRDLAVLGMIAVSGALTVFAWAEGGFYWRYYPSVRGAGAPVSGILGLAAYLLLCLTPLIIDIREDIVWKRLRSKI